MSLSKRDGYLESVRVFSTAWRVFTRREGYYKRVRLFTKAWEWGLYTRRGAYLPGVLPIYPAWAYLHGVGTVTTAWEALPKRGRNCKCGGAMTTAWDSLSKRDGTWKA